MSNTCWAGPLSRKERRELATKLARACGRFYRAASYDPRNDDADVRIARIMASTEMSDLHLDVTERAAVTP